MKRTFLGVTTLLLLWSTSALAATTVTFNNTAPAGQATGYGGNGIYIESGFTFTGTGNTSQYSLDPGFDNTNAPPDNSDFETFENGTAAWTLSAAGPFDLTSFQAAAIYGDGANTVALTGHVNGGGTVSTSVNLPAYNSTAQWNTFTLPAGWTNLDSVDFDYSGQFVGIDNVVLNGGAAAPVAAPSPIPSLSLPGLIALMLAMAAMSAALLRRKY